MRHSLFQSLLLLSLALASEASWAIPVYLHMESQFPSGHYSRTTLEARTRKIQTQRWARVETTDRVYGWLPERELVTARDLAADGNSKVFVPAGTEVFVLPGGAHARKLLTTGESKILNARSVKPGWVEVSTSIGRGFVNRSQVALAVDLGQSGTRVLSDHPVSLRSAPLPYANIVRTVTPGTRLKIVQHHAIKWGQAKLPDIGEAWWPMVSVASEERRKPVIERVSTDQLFDRKIFDMAASPAIAHLKFASAQGVYRTTDGKEWKKIPLFNDDNHPIAVAAGGAVFVGAYVSDDHGETFQQWIRWDSLVATFKHYPRVTAKSLRIQDIKPEDASGRRVILKLSVGQDMLVKLITDDQGSSWRPL